MPSIARRDTSVRAVAPSFWRAFTFVMRLWSRIWIETDADRDTLQLQLHCRNLLHHCNQHILHHTNHVSATVIWHNNFIISLIMSVITDNGCLHVKLLCVQCSIIAVYLTVVSFYFMQSSLYKIINKHVQIIYLKSFWELYNSNLYIWHMMVWTVNNQV